MDSLGAKAMKENVGSIRSNVSDLQARQKAALIEWLNSIHPDSGLPMQASDEQLRAFLLDGSVFCHILRKLRPKEANPSLMPQSERVIKFLKALGEMGIPRFELADLEKGSMKPVIDSLLSVQMHLLPNTMGEKRRILSESKFQRSLGSPVMSEPSAASIHHAGLKFHEVFQLKHGQYADLPPAKITEMMKSNSLDNAPTMSLLSVVNGILDESIQRKNAEVPHRVACLLRKVVQEIERRISTQAEHLRTQNNLFKAREEKYLSRIKVLEAIANATPDETEISQGRLQQIKACSCTMVEMEKIEEKPKLEDKDVERLTKEKEFEDEDVERLTKEKEFEDEDVERLTKEKELEDEDVERLTKEEELEDKDVERLTKDKEFEDKDVERLTKEKDNKNQEISALKQELEVVKKTADARCLQIEAQAKGEKMALKERVKELELQLTSSTSKLRELETCSETKNLGAKELERQLAASINRVKELEMYSESKDQCWNKKELIFQSFTDFQLNALQELRLSSNSIKQEVLEMQGIYSEEFTRLGVNFQALANAAANYHAVLMENRKLFNEVQDLKGNIRVYCRIRPFLPGQAGKQTIVEYAGDDGELVVANPSKQGKEGHRMFRFNKVFGPTASQADVYSDIQPYVRSVLDGYNVCIFAYGQTGSGKTYTMTGPNMATKATWGVNYRALNDLFQISETRRNTIKYEIMVQMIEIYNEQVRDLLSSDGSQKKLGILTANQSSGLAVPDASMHSVRATSDVLELMDVGFKNRAVGATAMNERSSRSHSILTIHARGTDLKRGTALRGSLHLVDLAGSERVDRSEVAGDRLREAQHINKSLSALGDVIFALSQKSAHVPYRNSKLTQVLQSSLGGQAKTLMFVQLNPDTTSYTESLSTLKFAERASGVELGAAKSSKEGRDVRELMEQVVSLRDTITKREEEIERLQLLRDLKNVNPEKCGLETSRLGSPSRNKKPLDGTGTGQSEKASSEPDDSPESHNDESKLVGDSDYYEERTSDASESIEGEINNIEDDSADQSDDTEQPDSLERPKSVARSTRPSLKSIQIASAAVSPKVSSGLKKPATGSSTLLKPPRRWQ